MTDGRVIPAPAACDEKATISIALMDGKVLNVMLTPPREPDASAPVLPRRDSIFKNGPGLMNSNSYRFWRAACK